MGKLGIIGIVFCVAKTCLLGATHFNLPAGTPGRQEVAETGEPALIEIEGKLYEQVVVPCTTFSLFFPMDGSQPKIDDAEEWSGATYVGNENDDAVTDWWVRVFGGRPAVVASRDGGDPYFDPKMGFIGKKMGDIVQVGKIVDVPEGFQQKFWSAFRVIASDPEGRLLLYRLLIEVRRVDDAGHGCCGPDIYLSSDFWLEKEIRNFFRSVAVGYDESDFDASDTELIEKCLFQELLRCFRVLRNPANKQEIESFKHQVS